MRQIIFTFKVSVLFLKKKYLFLYVPPHTVGVSLELYTLFQSIFFCLEISNLRNLGNKHSYLTDYETALGAGKQF